MGIFDFVRGAGRKPSTDDDAFDEQLEERRKGNNIMRFVMGLGLEIEQLRVDFDDGVATVTGEATDQATREKAVLAIGNTEGVAKVDDQMTVAAPEEPEAQMYTVKSGDTLGAIAKEFYGNAGKYPVIFEANRPMLEDPNKIYPGQVLRIPALSE